MPRIRRLGALAVMACACVTLLPAQADAAGSVHLTKIYYDSPGKDTRSNSSLNKEYAALKNTTGAAVSLKGWTLTDASRHTYTFGSYTLGKGKTVTVRTGSGGGTSATRYQGRKAYVWNNDKDKATLRRSSGSTADTCAYDSTRADYKLC